MAESILALCKRAAHWAWTRDEVDQETSRDRVLFISVMYVTVFVLVLVAGAVSLQFGHRSAGLGFWYFGLTFTGFIGAVAISWELLRYRSDRRTDRTPARAGPDRDLAPDLHVSRDTKIGFIVTLCGLAALLGAFQLARLLVSSLT